MMGPSVSMNVSIYNSEDKYRQISVVEKHHFDTSAFIGYHTQMKLNSKIASGSYYRCPTR